MQVKAAIITESHGSFVTDLIEVDEPRAHEVRVRTAFAGMCYSDETLRKGGISLPPEILVALSGRDSVFPIIAGHEGSGVIEALGAGVSGLAVGDHVAFSFVPSCLRCQYCLSGRPYLCDLLATTVAGPMISDQTWRHHYGDVPLNRMCQVGAFAEQVVVHEASVVRLEPWWDLRAAALVSCGVATGYGSAVDRGRVTAGDTVAVIGCGGVGSGAILGAAQAGARAVIAIDVNESKVTRARQIGATHGATSALDAAHNVLPDLTWGKNCDVVIVTVNTVTEEILEEARSITAKGGVIVVTALAPASQTSTKLNLFMLAMMNQEIRGTIFGSSSPRLQIPKLLRLHHEGKFPVDELVTREYSIDEVDQGYQDLRDGLNVRGVVRF